MRIYKRKQESKKVEGSFAFFFFLGRYRFFSFFLIAFLVESVFLSFFLDRFLG